LRLGYQQALSSLLDTPTPDPSFAKTIQQHLTQDGFLKSPITASFGPEAKTAMKAAFGTTKDQSPVGL